MDWVNAVIQGVLVGGLYALFATGLLVVNPIAGWTALAALLVRRLVSWRTGDRYDSPRYILAGGLIAGSALTSFFSGVASGMFSRRVP